MKNQKLNVRGTLNSLAPGEEIIFPRALYQVSSIRSVASILTADYGKKFSVSAKGANDIMVMRTI